MITLKRTLLEKCRQFFCVFFENVMMQILLFALMFFYTVKVNGEISTTTPAPQVFPCNSYFLFAYDRSAKLSRANFYRQVNFLYKQVISTKWTVYSNTAMIGYAENATLANFGQFNGRKDIEDFVLKNGHIDEDPSLCSVFYALQNTDLNNARVFIFVSDYQEKLNSTCINYIQNIQSYFAILNFVVLNYENVNLHWLYELSPYKARILLWDIQNEEVPADWEKQMAKAYRCDYIPNPPYPCENKILVGIDQSQQLSSPQFNQMINFINNYLFYKWDRFNGLALWLYAATITPTDFGNFSSYDEVFSAVAKIKQLDENLDLCNVFDALSKLDTVSPTVILFISSFNKDQVDGDCELAIQTTKQKVNSITFVALTDDVSDLEHFFWHVKLIKWNMGRESVPLMWEWDFWRAYECGNNKFDGGYPCDTKILIGYDKTNQFSSNAFERQQNFILDNVIGDNWSRFSKLAIMDSAASQTILSGFGVLKNKDFVTRFIQSVKQVNSGSYFCGTLSRIYNADAKQVYILLFVSTFIQGSDDKCGFNLEETVKEFAGITVVSMNSNVNVDRLKEIIPQIKIVDWSNIEEKEVPENWEQQIWESFGCDGRSPLLGPYISTIEPTTHLTTAIKQDDKTQTVSNTERKHSPINWGLYLGLGIPLLLIIIWSILTCYCLDRRKQKRKRDNLKNALREGYMDRNQYIQKTNNDDLWELLPDNVIVNYNVKLGSGAFGCVYGGMLIGDAAIQRVYDSPMLNKFHNCKVAVKQLRETADEFEKNDFYQEINFMKDLKFHPHLVCMLGYVQDIASPLLVLEFCANGDLLQFVRKNKEKFVENADEKSEFKPKMLVSFSYQIANGLEYLASLGLIHRDVAARNILLDKNNICKISDFGLCRTSDNMLYTSRGGKLPVKWMAPESLKSYIFSTKTDIWSYSVLLFEIFSFGEIPYMQTENILAFLESGRRLDKPGFCSNDIYEIMLNCWEIDPEKRPTFTDICSSLKKLLEDANSQYNYVDAIHNAQVKIEVLDSEEICV